MIGIKSCVGVHTAFCFRIIKEGVTGFGIVLVFDKKRRTTVGGSKEGFTNP